MKPVIGMMMLAGLLASQSSNAASLSKDDEKYLAETAQGLMSELKLGALAQERAGDQRVKDFGKQMVTDHGKDLQELKDIAAKKQVRLPEEMDEDQRKEADKLGKLTGKAFDREYVNYETKDHRADIKEQKEEADKTADPDLKQFATKALATVTGHKHKVDALRAHVK
jgi:putative membrane protein